MWKLHRYYLKELGINSGITFLVLMAVMVVSFVARGIQRSESGGLGDAALITLFFALDSFPHLLFISFLIATVLTFTRAAQDRELIAIRAAGISPRVPMAAALMVGIAMSVAGSVAMHYVIPEVHYRKYRVVADVVRNTFMNLRLHTDRVKFGNYVLTFSERPGKYEFRDCAIYCPPGRSIGGLRSTIVRVDRVTMAAPTEGSESIDILLEGAHDPISGNRTNVPFSFSMREIADQARREDADDDLQSDQLLSEVLRGVHEHPNQAIYTLFRRSCFALMPFLLAPIGFCVAEFSRLRGRVLALVLALLPLTLFYVGEVVGRRILRETGSPWSAWMPAVLLAVFAVPFCWRQLRR